MPWKLIEKYSDSSVIPVVFTTICKSEQCLLRFLSFDDSCLHGERRLSPNGDIFVYFLTN